MTLRRLTPDDASAYRALMLEAYERHPEAFTSSVDERAALPLSWWQARLDPAPGAGQIVLGAFVGEQQLAGVVGLEFESRRKSRHKADLFGMYVAPAARKTGVGRELVRAALEQAAAREGVRLVQLTVTQGNDAAQALYAQCGFVPFGVEPQAIALDGVFFSKIHMWCALGPM